MMLEQYARNSKKEVYSENHLQRALIQEIEKLSFENQINRYNTLFADDFEKIEEKT